MTRAVTATSDSVDAPAAGVTRALVDCVRDISFERLSDEALVVAKHCVLDWLGVTLAGAREPLSQILAAELVSADGGREAAVLGHGSRASAPVAALLNGAASHALDFDDMHLAMTGHPTAPVAPAALALAERLDASGGDLLAALVCGVETECRCGLLLNPSHYAAGWHATGTLGTFGAAAACARLLALDHEQWLHALGTAGTQAAGLKSMFGTMCKPLHAGKAAMNGLLAATLAGRGFTSSTEVVEAPQGFGATHAHGVDGGAALDAVAGRFLIRDVLFKYHAACYLTHAAIEGALRLREQGLAPDDVAELEVEVDHGVLAVADIECPRTGLEGKFSLRAVAAMALLGDDTAAPASYSDARMADPALVALRDRVRVAGADRSSMATATVRARTVGGEELSASADTGTPADDLDRQGERLRAKFARLAEPVVGAARAEELVRVVDGLDRLDSVSELTDACRP
jgi:2-methylcitrate dehydratase PrpD